MAEERVPQNATPTPARKNVSPEIIVAAALAVILLIFIIQNDTDVKVSWVVFSRRAALWVVILVSAVLGAGIAYASVQNLRSEMQREISEAQDERGGAPFFSAEQQDELSRSVAESIRVEEQEGYWLTLGALLLAALFAGLTLASRRVAATGPPGG